MNRNAKADCAGAAGRGRLVVVSNRVAVPSSLRKAQGGLAVGVLAALREQGGLWFGWDGRTLEYTPTGVKTVEQDNITFATVSLSRHHYEAYYTGFANRVLWPLFHFRLNLMDFQRSYLQGYQRVNAQFAAGLRTLVQPDDLLWIHDYHLIPLGEELRNAGLTQRLGFFLHIPFPPFDVLRALPCYKSLLRWLCAYDLVGFQTASDQRAFLEGVSCALGAKVRGAEVNIDGCHLDTGVFPIGIDVDEVSAQAARGRMGKQGRRLEESLGGRQLITGVDRLDYSKGLVERFRAFGRLLENYPSNRNQVVFLQIAQPSRSDVPEYDEIRHTLDGVAGEINGHYSEYDWTPLRYLNKGFARSTVLGFLAASRIGLVTPLRDGMNLVAKEYVAAQDPQDPGVLVLSALAGAADELGDGAIVVNPYDIDEVADGLARASAMELRERRERLNAMMGVLRRNDIHAWRERFVQQLAAAPQHAAGR